MVITAAQKQLLTLFSLGGVLEFYDFIIYALLAEHISTAFFPTGNDITSLMLTFATFSVGYLVRPIGGILFGHFGDRHGRKITFTFSILIMAISTFAIGLIPTHNSIGIMAPILVLFFRICQGLSVGGEIPGALAYFGISLAISATIMGLVWGTIPSLLAQLFPTQFRYSGIAVSYNIGFALFAGLTPLIASF